MDPFDNDERRPWTRWFAAPMPAVRCDYVLTTHDHFDHRAVHRVTAGTTVRDACDVSGPGLRILGVADEHVPGHGPPGMSNVVFLIEAGGVRCCHWGDNRADPPRSVVEQLGRVDILMVPVDDSRHLLQYAEIDAIVEAVNPRVIVPMHYFHPSVSDPQSPLGAIDEWLNGQTCARRSIPGAIELAPQLSPEERQIWVLAPTRGGPAAADD